MRLYIFMSQTVPPQFPVYVAHQMPYCGYYFPPWPGADQSAARLAWPAWYAGARLQYVSLSFSRPGASLLMRFSCGLTKKA